MRTRLLAATLTAFAAVSLAACSSSGTGSGTSTAAAGSPSTAATTTAPDAASPGATTAPATTTAPSAGATDPAAPSAGATGAPAPATPSAPATDGGSTAAPAKPAPPADAGLPAKPDGGLTDKLVAALKAIDPAIVGDKPDQAVDRARNQCQAMYQFPKDKAKLVELANQRFTSPDHPQGFGPDTAAKINDALRATLCPPA
ncbi:hypothetical protein ACFYUY_01160 [Kitasatospora sp. NPDC004745]|uniref:hypothetical protein n=1 Tax=Kitasatospora sp. NPDC004745 TaxID=3364019 RepID=UPI00369D4AD9